MSLVFRYLARTLENTVVPERPGRVCAYDVERWADRSRPDSAGYYSVRIEGAITHIEANAFHGDRFLTEAVIENGVRVIGANAFKNCSSLKRLVVPPSVTEIHTGAFCGCSSLVHVELSAVDSVGSLAFFGCTSLAEVALLSVRVLGEHAFSGCSSLAHVELSDTLLKVPGYAFCNCTSLATLQFGAQVQSVGIKAYKGCASLSSAVLPRSVYTLHAGAFADCGALESVEFAAFGRTGFIGVFKMGTECFARTAIRTITLPGTLLEIAERAFAGCSNLGSIKGATAVERIGYRAFYNCRELGAFPRLGELISISEGAFYGCVNLRSVLLPEAMSRIGNVAFQGCTALASVQFSRGPIAAGAGREDGFRIGERAFADCRSLEHINFPRDLAGIGDQAFQECVSLVSIVLGHNLVHQFVGEWLFYGCTRLDYVEFGDKIGKIEYSMLPPQLKYLAVPRCLDTMSRHALPKNAALLVRDTVSEVSPMWRHAFAKSAQVLGGGSCRNAGCLWASDHVVEQLRGSLGDFNFVADDADPAANTNTFAKLPRRVRAAPDAKTWAAVQLWVYWSPPTGAGYVNRQKQCKDRRIVAKARRRLLFAATASAHAAALRNNGATLPALPPPIWLVIFGFLKHERPPVPGDVPV